MPFHRVSLPALLLLALAAPGAVRAQQDAYCTFPGTRQVDPQATATFQQLAQQADPQTMGMLTGLWYAELRSPQTNQVDYHYNSYEPGGLFQYRSRVCGGMMNACSEYSGTGLYAARQTGDGSFFGMLIVSDLSRDHQCSGMNGRFLDPGTMATSDGTIWRRAR